MSRLPRLASGPSRLDRLLGLRPAMLGAVSFLVAILLGAVLLSTPWAAADGGWTNPVDSLFTATSAVCVTGLIVKDTGQYWSLFGQGVILVLIQAGGIGIMTLSAFVAWMLGRRLTFRSQAVLGEVLEERARGMRDVVRYIVLLTLTVETIGAALLFWAWRDESGQGGVLATAYRAAFHAISGFCNAGFSLNSNSLEADRANLGVNGIMMGLIVVGGLGFPVIRNLQLRLRRSDPLTGVRPKLSVQTKMVLWLTLVLILVGWVAFLALEWDDSLAGMSTPEKVLAGLFQSVTPRTAGFNTVRIAEIMPATAFMMIILMFIGASPGSTGGGVKTTTVGTMVFALLATVRGRRRVEVFRHTLDPMAVKRAMCIFFLGVASVGLGFFLLLISEGFILTGEFTALDTLFEVFSAFGTVGLSRGVTPHLSAAGRLVVTVLMFVGRLGPLTLLLAIGGAEDRAAYRFPDARIMIG